ncbi:MAG: HD domain-containing protein [Actinobacteria bacterium]|nr:HD domain-containing protein [Actinomycetota bacterium]
MGLPYDDVHLISDPLYGYLRITTPRDDDETAESDLLDDPWVQRLKRIHQLQSSWWVFPTAEHSRFAHSLGVMHLAGTLAAHVYPTLRAVLLAEGADTSAAPIPAAVAPSSGTGGTDAVSPADAGAVPAAASAGPLPSCALVEETLRVAGLLHDVGHGPFSHFCDEQYLHPRWGLDHEQISQRLITHELAPAIGALRRSPGGELAAGEAVDPAHVAWLVRGERGDGESESGAGSPPRWVRLLARALSGAATVDNMDYVRRDAYMCGVSLGAVDVERLVYYSFCTDEGLTLHKRALGALRAFLNARLYMYENVYFHRIGGAIDMHLREIFADTLALILPESPLDDLAAYRRVTEWSLFEEVEGWLAEPPGTRRRRLGDEWRRIIHRDVKYHAVFEQQIEHGQPAPGTRELSRHEFEAAIRRALPAELVELEFRVDVASQDPRPVNPLRGPKRIPVYDPVTGTVADELLGAMLAFVPARAHLYRVYSVDREHERDLAEAARAALGEVAPASLTNL